MYLFIFTIKSVAKSAQSIKKATRLKVVTILEKKLKIIADFEGENRTMNIRRELGTPSTTVKVTSGGKQKHSTNLNILIRFNSVGICMYKICFHSVITN
jgi:hypothetical protein